MYAIRMAACIAVITAIISGCVRNAPGEPRVVVGICMKDKDSDIQVSVDGSLDPSGLTKSITECEKEENLWVSK